MSRVAQRLIPVVVALGLAACGNPASPLTTPNRALSPGGATYDEFYAPDGTYCVSGYNVAQGRCN